VARRLIRGIALVTAIAVGLPPPSFAQPKLAPVTQGQATDFNFEQVSELVQPNRGAVPVEGCDEEVRSLQQALNSLGASPQLAVDGQFGSGTREALRAFQKAAGLVADGVPGPATKAAIRQKLDQAPAEATEFDVEQLDAMLASIALYPDELLIQILMASTYPLQVVAASRWLEQGDNKNLKGDALAMALERENWDPSVKSLVPFPQVIAMMNDNLEWTQQLGYAVAAQQAAVLDSIQRLRRQAESAGNLETTSQQRVVVEKENIVIQPADPQTVYVPVYNPNEVYGAWPYPSYPPVYIPPPPAYYPPGYALGAGLAFATGVAVVGGLWGWARPAWSTGTVNVNTVRYNSISVNRAPIGSATWRPPAVGVGGRPIRPPAGPVGLPARPSQLPANAIGRANVKVSANAVNRPQISVGGADQNRLAGVQRQAGGQVNQPAAGQRQSAGQLPAGGQRAGQLPAGGQRVGTGQLPAGQRQGLGQGQLPSAAQRPAGAFGGIGDGARASQFSARGAQSRNFQQSAVNRGGRFQGRAGGGGFQGRAGGGGGLQGRAGGRR
jgi:Protein of unknown function (DUF3300)/Putative peptidoglycan binding domain